jgi:hypothetical protein
MNFKLIAVTGIGLLAGACSLRPLGTPAAYSSLPAEDASVHVTATRNVAPRDLTAASAFGPARLAVAPVMPGDFVGAQAEPRGVRIDPVASLKSSMQASSQWETLRPGSLTRAPLLQSRLAAALASIGRSDVQTGSVHGANEMTPPPSRKNDDYDREAAMSRLVEGGRIAARKICEGC